MWGIVLLIFFVAGSRQLSITEFSVPEAVESGKDVLLQCGYQLASNETGNGLTVKWWFTPLNESDDEPIQLYQRIAGQPPEKTRTDIEIKGEDDILLRNVIPENSGNYECAVSAVENEKRRHDSLIVFTMGELILNITEIDDGPDEDADDDVVITCEVVGAAPFPDLVITLDDEELTSDDTVLHEGNSTFDVITAVTPSSRPAHGASVGCELYFRNANITHDQYKVTKLFNAGPPAPTTTEAADASTTEAAPGNRIVGTASSLLLVITSIFVNIIAFNH